MESTYGINPNRFCIIWHPCRHASALVGSICIRMKCISLHFWNLWWPIFSALFNSVLNCKLCMCYRCHLNMYIWYCNWLSVDTLISWVPSFLTTSEFFDIIKINDGLGCHFTPSIFLKTQLTWYWCFSMDIQQSLDSWHHYQGSKHPWNLEVSFKVPLSEIWYIRVLGGRHE